VTSAWDAGQDGEMNADGDAECKERMGANTLRSNEVDVVVHSLQPLIVHVTGNEAANDEWHTVWNHGVETKRRDEVEIRAYNEYPKSVVIVELGAGKWVTLGSPSD
jgi:hypothetical protein